jgi:hypothetical protein
MASVRGGATGGGWGGAVVWRSLASTTGGKAWTLTATFRGVQRQPPVFSGGALARRRVLKVLIGKWGRTETSMRFSANAPASSGRPSLVSQSAISCSARTRGRCQSLLNPTTTRRSPLIVCSAIDSTGTDRCGPRMPHKFKVGQLVYFHPKGLGPWGVDAARGPYQILRLLPATDDGEFQYERRQKKDAPPRFLAS